MSFFLAKVPVGTQLYHGTPGSEPVEGMEWLAFEPEHALIFAHARGPRHPGPPPGEGHHDREADEMDQKKYGDQQHQRPFQAPHDADLNNEEPKHGFLHTYAPKRPLNLLYIDGMSAGKTQNGTLDTQDILLLNWTSVPDNGMWSERERAQTLCNFTSTIWENKIDGILRMEGGFEIILCHFERDLEVKSIMPVVENGWPGSGMMGGWQYYKAITERYHGIGGERVELDYDNFVSAFEYDGLDLWRNNVNSDVPMPRLENAKAEDLEKIRTAVGDMILKSDTENKKQKKVNWQSTADLLITRYSTPLHQLHTSATLRSNKEDFSAYLTALLRPFIDYTSRNTTLETTRCISQMVPTLPSKPTLAHKTIHHITSEVCITLLTTLDITSTSLSRSVGPKNPHPSHALDLIDKLVAYLQWTTWKQCPTCSDEEICFIPIWPMGSFEDHAEPKCRGKSEARGRNGYWGRWGPGRRPPPDKGGEEMKGGEVQLQLEL
ncbi:hypothetical protein P154DRAFT_419136 [Amniculicola lignicola CBS 123094]|uniref:Uncharacterized protein n=1 Tax=Amniculicola lignicola CBS 123094 TaxID=1392246 RepID=A0A6A5X5T6_9PLEO|nr:hypothetical protein P154DRAFT_419136 [Amniculicola lignicola CBS 123094]